MRKILFLLIALGLVSVIFGCGDKKPKLDYPVQIINSELSQPVFWLITSKESGTEWSRIIKIPGGEEVYKTERKNLLSVWGSGILIKSEDGLEWHDFDAKSGNFVKLESMKFSEWDTPVSVDPEERRIFILAHSVPPTRSIQIFNITNNEKDEFGQFVAETVDFPSPLPSCGWSSVIVNRPGQAGAVTPDMSNKTEKIRLYYGRNYGGEYESVKNQWIFEEGVIAERDDGFSIYTFKGGPGLDNKRLSWNQVPGNPRPMDILGDDVLVCYDIVDDSGNHTESQIYFYGLYSRKLELACSVPKENSPKSGLLLDENQFLLTGKSDKGKGYSVKLGKFSGDRSKPAELSTLAEATPVGEVTESILFLVKEPKYPKLVEEEVTESTVSPDLSPESEKSNSE